MVVHVRAVSSLLLVGVLMTAGTFSPADAADQKEPPAPPQLGEEAPDFELAAINGKKSKLSTLTKAGPVVLVVLRGYPGYQCPLCNGQVGQFLGRAEKFADSHAQIVFIYPGPADQLKKRAAEFIQDKTLPDNCRLLLDPDYKFTNAWHLRWNAPKETAYPSTFVIDSANKVRYSKVSDSHGGRASADEVIDALTKK